MDKTRLYFSITDAMTNKIANFPQFNKIDHFLTEVSSRLETLINSDDEEETADYLSELVTFLRDYAQIECDADLKGYYDDLDCWHSDSMLDLFIKCVSSGDSERTAGLSELMNHDCKFIFNNRDDYEHDSLTTYADRQAWINDLVIEARDYIGDSLNIFYMSPANITEEDLSEDLKQIESWNDYALESIDLND